MAATPPLRLLRLANPVVRLVLRSPVHGLLSGSLALLTYRGYRSGRTFTIPVLYATDGDRVVAVAARPERKLWWRTFRPRAAAQLTVRRARRDVVGRVVDGEERDGAVEAYLARFPRAARSARAGAAVVTFEPRCR
jgi:hypothetical protein